MRTGRSPYGERGLKSAGYTSGGTVSLSRSPYGERGLKFSVIPGDIVDAASRSPYGERGLKFKLPAVDHELGGSLPVRGAWIEIPRTNTIPDEETRRSPYGERGLKSV